MDDRAGRERAGRERAGRDRAGMTAGRWDRDPVRPNPGPGAWIDQGPVAAPDSHSSLTPRMLAGLGLRAPAARDPGDRVRWSADLGHATTRTVR